MWHNPCMTQQLSCQTHGPYRRRCNGCHAVSNQRRMRDRKVRLVAMAGGACSQCGYNRCLAALEFHHVDPATKDISLARSMSWARCVAELAKCVLLCANCHREVDNLVDNPEPESA